VPPSASNDGGRGGAFRIAVSAHIDARHARGKIFTEGNEGKVEFYALSKDGYTQTSVSSVTSCLNPSSQLLVVSPEPQYFRAFRAGRIRSAERKIQQIAVAEVLHIEIGKVAVKWR
jgi:hypothetical protein